MIPSLKKKIGKMVIFKTSGTNELRMKLDPFFFLDPFLYLQLS